MDLDGPEVGGFECYLAADEVGGMGLRAEGRRGGQEETVEAQEVYRGDTDGPLVRTWLLVWLLMLGFLQLREVGTQAKSIENLHEELLG